MASTNGNYETRGPVVFAVTTAMIVLASTFVFLRVVSRVGIVRRFKLDDYFMVAAWVRLAVESHAMSQTLSIMTAPRIWDIFLGVLRRFCGVGTARIRHSSRMGSSAQESRICLLGALRECPRSCLPVICSSITESYLDGN